MRISGAITVFIYRQPFTNMFSCFLCMKYFAKSRGTGCHINNHRMAVFHRETKGDGVSTQKALGAAMGSHAGIGLRHYDSNQPFVGDHLCKIR